MRKFVPIKRINTYYVDARCYGVYDEFILPMVIGIIIKGFIMAFKSNKVIPIKDRTRTCNLLELEVAV